MTTAPDPLTAGRDSTARRATTRLPGALPHRPPVRSPR